MFDRAALPCVGSVWLQKPVLSLAKLLAIAIAVACLCPDELSRMCMGSVRLDFVL